MGRGTLLIGLLLSCLVLVDGCITSQVTLGDNVCLLNPTFKGTSTDEPGIEPRTSPSPNLPDWQVCSGSVDVNPGVCTLPASPGTTTYVGLAVGYAAFQYATSTSMSTPLFNLVPPGQYPFSVDLGVAIMTVPRGGFGFAGGAPVELVIYGSSTPCGRDQELARTMLIANTDSWKTYSGVLLAHQSFSNLVLVPTLANASTPGRAGAYVNIAKFALPSCH